MTSQSGATPVQGMQSTSSESAAWSNTDNSVAEPQGYGSPHDSKDSSAQYLNYLRGFANPMQKKVTRDGQPAKRRGPKPDSKPAQTRRQELNRQAQRTHRERKEQYIKALEAEISRLREAFVQESAAIQQEFEYQKTLLRDQTQENLVLREMLSVRGVAVEAELQNRLGRSGMSVGPQDSSRGISPAYNTPRPSPFANTLAAPSSAHTPDVSLQGYGNGSSSAFSGQSPTTHHSSHSPPDMQEMSAMRSPYTPDTPGIFERDPQLGIDFILALEETCRDHGEYLVRRSLNSSNAPEEALFSGHALMASCPPPSHIDSTPAKKGGVEPTYPHQAPSTSLQTLNTLLDLSQVIKLEGYVEGGQVTPIMALQSLRGSSIYHSLTREDVVGMIEAVRNKVRCYGFGAVMEDFELRDALATISATKPEAYANFGNANLTDEIDEMYS